MEIGCFQVLRSLATSNAPFAVSHDQTDFPPPGAQKHLSPLPAWRQSERFRVSSDRVVKDRLTLIGFKNPSQVAVATYDLGDIAPIERFDVEGRIQVVRDDGEVETPGKAVTLVLKRSPGRRA